MPRAGVGLDAHGRWTSGREPARLRVDSERDYRIWLVAQSCVEELLVGADCKRQRPAGWCRAGDSNGRDWRQIAAVVQLKYRDVLAVRIAHVHESGGADRRHRKPQ